MIKTLAIILYVLGLAGTHCYAACNAANAVDGEIQVWNGGYQVSNNGNVNIPVTAVMPTLTAKLTGSPSGTVVWTLDQEYTDGNREDGPGYGPKSQSATLDWNINASLNSHFIGGDITVTLKADAIECPFTFRIRGLNPPTNVVYTYVGTSPWYLIPQVKQESVSRQFTGGLPLHSLDNGWGLFQLTDPEPTVDQLWNWKANVDEGKSRMVGFYNDAYKWMNDPLDNGKTKDPNGIPYPGQRIQAFNTYGYHVPIVDDPYGNVTFSDSSGAQYTFEDGIAVKWYNGGKSFYSWSQDSSSTGHWHRGGIDYITAVCAKVIQ
ncbi:MAG: hypothetical protein PF692_02065 [Kiritimatiellae bacterium]|jgi:hypothetical protein|nr:hypothetical protein [Kiritimatiellia bacterium]